MRPNVFATAALSALLLAACGSDSSTDTNSDGDKTADAPDTTAEDKGKDAGGETTTSTMYPGANKDKCGGTMCPKSAVGTASCCTEKGAGVEGDPNEFAGRAPDLCGTDLGPFVGLEYACIQMNQPGTLDPACPEVDSPGGKLMGCCTDTGWCGGMETGIPLGCTYPVEGKVKKCGAAATP